LQPGISWMSRTTMADELRPGDVVETPRTDPPHHTRVPRYARGATGTVVDFEGEHPLPDNRARGIATAPESVYTVRFAGDQLFDGTDHDIVLSMWRSYLTKKADDE